MAKQENRLSDFKISSKQEKVSECKCLAQLAKNKMSLVISKRVNDVNASPKLSKGMSKESGILFHMLLSKGEDLNRSGNKSRRSGQRKK